MAGKPQKHILWLGLFGLLTIILWNVPGGNTILYPFTLLATWFHEMAHGLSAILMGGSFNRLVINSDGSGLAEFSYTRLFLGPFGKAFVAGAGPIGPTIAGFLMIYASVKPKLTSFAVYFLAITLFLSALIWIRPVFGVGFFVVIIFALVLFFIAYKGNSITKVLSLQFLAIQAYASIYQSISYFYTSEGTVGGSYFKSDTQVMADNLLLPYWFWATLIVLFSIYMIYLGFKKAAKK